MIIDVLQCSPEGTQTMIQREVPNDYFPPEPEFVSNYTAFLDGVVEGYENG